MPQNYGFTTSARRIASDYDGWIFLSGQSLEARKFRLIIPLRKGDYIPVWETQAGAAAVMVLLIPAPGEVWKLQVGSIRETMHAGGPQKEPGGLFRGVEAWTVPEVIKRRWRDRGGWVGENG